MLNLLVSTCILYYITRLNIYSSQTREAYVPLSEADSFSIPLLKHWIILFIGFSEVNLEMVYVYSDHTRYRNLL